MFFSKFWTNLVPLYSSKWQSVGTSCLYKSELFCKQVLLTMVIKRLFITALLSINVVYRERERVTYMYWSTWGGHEHARSNTMTRDNTTVGYNSAKKYKKSQPQHILLTSKLIFPTSTLPKKPTSAYYLDLQSLFFSDLKLARSCPLGFLKGLSHVVSYHQPHTHLT